MAWEKRGDPVNSYYYQSYREGGRVRKRYFGRSERAQLEWIVSAEDRDRRQAVRQSEAEADLALRTAAGWDEVAQFCGAVDAALEAALAGCGYHRHARGEWRKRRGS